MFRNILVLALLVVVGFPAFAAQITVEYSEGFSEELAEEYGQKEGVYLSERLIQNVQTRLEPEDLAKIDSIKILILDAKPNRPTFQQLSHTSGLSYQSFSLGGMALEVEVILIGQDAPVNLEYHWYGNDIRWAQSASTWSDARKAARRFVKKLQKAL